MSVQIFLLSRLSWDFLHHAIVDKEDIPTLSLLRKKLREIYKGLKITQYLVYFRFSKRRYINITDSFRYAVFFNMDANRILYVYLVDCDHYYRGTRKFLTRLENREIREAKIQNRTKYDVKIPEDDYVEESDEDHELDWEEPTFREMVTHATRKLEDPRYFTADLTIRNRLINGLKKVL